ncbi:MAG: ATP-binding protein [Sphingomonas sp.]
MAPLRLLLTVLVALVAATTPSLAKSTVLAVDATPTSEKSIDSAILAAKDAMLVDPRQTVRIAANIERRVSALPQTSITQTQLASAQWLQGEALLRLNQPDRAQESITRAFLIVNRQTGSTRLKGDLLLTRGGIRGATGDVAGALRDYQSAHNIFRDVGELRRQAITLITIAWLYQEAKNYDTALKYYSQAFDLYRADPKLLLSIYNNRGSALQALERYPEAQQQFRAGLTLARKFKSPVVEAQILRNIVRDALASNNLPDAEAANKESMQLAGKLGGASLAQAQSIAAQVAYQKGDTAHAADLIARAFAGMDVNKTTLAFRDAHQTAYLIYNKLGQSGLALDHLNALKRLDDETAKLVASANTALLAAQFDYANQELKISKLRQRALQRNIEFERSRGEFQRTIFTAVGIATLIGVAMLTFGLITIRRSRNEVRAANIDLADTNLALEKALAAKTEFLATTSHEIRTPLNGILGMTQVMLADDKLAPDTRDRVSVVHGAGITMRALVDDILDVAKMESGNMTVENVPFDLRSTMTDVSKLWQEQASAKGIAFELLLDDCPHMVRGDAARLRQIIFNLLSNALKFTSHGAVRLAASTSGDRLKISVSDTGIGVPADKLQLIFESFRQVDAGTTRRFGGTGLGLTICRNLARAMGGDVTVESQPGIGTTFTIDLPHDAVAAEELAAAGSGDGRALLIVDRNPISRSMLKALFEPHAGSVVVAGSIGDAITAIGSGKIARAVIDDGAIKQEADLHGALASLHAAVMATDVDLVVLWAAPGDTERTLLAAAGIDSVVSKPIAGAALIEMLYASEGADRSDSAAPAKLPFAA